MKSLIFLFVFVFMIYLVHGDPQMGNQRWGQRERGSQMGNGVGLNLGLGLGRSSVDYESAREGSVSGSSSSSYRTMGARRKRNVAGCNGQRGGRGGPPPQTTTTTAATTTTTASSG